MARLHTAKWFEHRAFFKNLSGRWASTIRDHTILSVERRQIVVGDKKFGVVSYVLVGVWRYSPPENFWYFSTPRTEMWAFCETDFWIYSVTLCFDRPCTCMVCLCKYHNWVTQGVGNLLNLVGPTPTRRNHGWRRAGKFWVSRLLEMAFSESSFCYLWL